MTREAARSRLPRRGIVASLLLAFCWAAWAGGAPVWDYEIVAEHPHDPRAFTQGLILAGDRLFESTGQYGDSELRRVELGTGRVLESRKLAGQLFGEGLALFGDWLYQLTWRAGRCLVYGADNLAPFGEHRYQGEGWGLTSDGEHLLMSDGSSRIQVRDPADFKLLDQIQVRDGDNPVPRLNELEWIRGLIWANVWQTTRIAIIDPETGKVVAWLDLAALVQRQPPGSNVLNGIAYDAESGRILVTGKWWPKLYEIRTLMR